MGTWYKIERGQTTATEEVKRYQGMGNTTREAKFNAATNAILKMGDSIPGSPQYIILKEKFLL